MLLHQVFPVGCKFKLGSLDLHLVVGVGLTEARTAAAEQCKEEAVSCMCWAGPMMTTAHTCRPEKIAARSVVLGLEFGPLGRHWIGSVSCCGLGCVLLLPDPPCRRFSFSCFFFNNKKKRWFCFSFSKRDACYPNKLMTVCNCKTT